MSSPAASSADLVDAVVRFCRDLGSVGVRVHADASQAALLALREIPLVNRSDFRTALRLSVVKRAEDLPLFDHLFNLFWGTGRAADPSARAMRSLTDRSEKPRRGRAAATEAERESGEGTFGGTRSVPSALGEPADAPPVPRPADAASGSLFAADSVVPDPRSEDDLDRLARKLAPLLATRRSRRWQRDRRGTAIDLRRALRESLRFGGAPIELPRRSRRRTRSRLVIFCDVSRSMDESAAFFLRFSAAVLRRLWRVEVFLFATDVLRVTPIWLRESWSTLKLQVPDLGGGTQIGLCLSRFLEHYEHSLLGADTTVVVFSDGLDAGEPLVLDLALGRLRRRSRAIFWLNPLLHLPGYEPTARGMAVALEHIDLFAPAHDVRSLASFVERLRSIGLRPRGIDETEARRSRRAAV